MKYKFGGFTSKSNDAINFAISNAENNNGLSADNLIVTEVFANQGPTMKRLMPKAQGRGARIRKRTCHITVVLKEAK